MTPKLTFALFTGLSVAIGSLGMSAPAQAAELKLKASSQVQKPRAAQARLSAEPDHTGGEVVASQDFTSECIAYGGGASTDPDGFEMCTGPDGEDIIVPLP